MSVSSENSFIDIRFTSKICFSWFAMLCYAMLCFVPRIGELKRTLSDTKCNIQMPAKLQQLQAFQTHL